MIGILDRSDVMKIKLKRPKLDLDIKKKVIFKITAAAVKVFEPEDYIFLMESNSNVYNIIQEDMPELINRVRDEGRKGRITRDLINRFNVEDTIDEFLVSMEEYLEPLYRIPRGRQWTKKQIQHLLREIYS